MQTRVRASVLCVHEGKLLLVRQQDPVSKRIYLFPPGGRIEAGELPADAARRETREETGFDVVIDEKTEAVLDYLFPWGGALVPCKTHFFRAHLASLEAGPLDETNPHLGVHWLPLAEVPAQFDFHDDLRAHVARLLAPAP